MSDDGDKRNRDFRFAQDGRAIINEGKLTRIREKSGACEPDEPYELLELEAPGETYEQEFSLRLELQPRMNAHKRE
jgi:hypothetical protein